MKFVEEQHYSKPHVRVELPTLIHISFDKLSFQEKANWICSVFYLGPSSYFIGQKSGNCLLTFAIYIILDFMT